MLLMIDNYDSFTYNLVQYLGELGAEVAVHRNDAIGLDDIERMAPERIVLSPGPCTPNEAGISLAVVERFAGRIPLLGVCLGHQAIGQAFGGDVVHAKSVMHGKTSWVHHHDGGVFAGLPQPMEATRYHSLVLDPGRCRHAWRPPPGPRWRMAASRRLWVSATVSWMWRACSSIPSRF